MVRSTAKKPASVIAAAEKPKNFVTIAAKYRNDILAGRIVACEWVKKACERERADRVQKNWTWRFDAEKANDVCNFVEKLPHTKGIWATRHERIKLRPWQIFILTTMFGWVNGAGNRRFRTAYIEVPRKNGKSILGSAIALYTLVMDGEAGAEVYSAATSRDQAAIVWKGAYNMVQQSPAMATAFGIELLAHAITQKGTNSAFKALSSEDFSLEGLNIHCCIVDELHAHKTRGVWDAIESGTGARTQPLIVAITTAGSDRSGICYEIREYLTKVLNGVHPDESFFGIIYAADLDDDWKSPKIWKKANPNLGISVFEDDFARLATKAIRTPSAQNNFLTKRLDLWVAADVALFSTQAWADCATPGLQPIAHEQVWLGIDLAPRHDFCALAMIFKREGEYFVFVKHYLSEDEVEESGNAQFDGWAAEGRITTNIGGVTDYNAIQDDIRKISKEYEIVQIAFDPFTAHQFATQMTAEGFPMVECRAIVANFSEATKQLDALMADKKIHHDGCPLLAWEMSNVSGHYDRKNNVLPVKTHQASKIDGPTAVIMALNRVNLAMPCRSIYATGEEVFIDI